jgi:regulator of replication initiation timing
MATRSARVGVHGRNDYWQCRFEESDYQLIREARIEHVKMMISDQAARLEVLRNAIGVYKRLREINPDMDFVVRLFDAEVRDGRHPTPQVFASRFAPIMNGLHEECPYVVKFEVLNEPNHPGGLGGWGPEADKARDFSGWFLETYELLKVACPWASLGFPGLAIPHGDFPDKDLGWAKACRPAVERADWLGVHCYWQNPTYTERNHLHPDWGLRFNAYHEEFPDKIIEITEFGNSNGQSGFAIDPAKIAQEYVEYYQGLFSHHYINSAASFIMSSSDAVWGNQGFTWRKENGEFWPVVRLVGGMERPPLVTAVEWLIAQLRREAQSLRQQAAVPQATVAQLQQEVQGLRQQLATSQQTIIQLQQEAQSLRQQATAPQAAVAQLQQEVQGLRQQLSTSQETVIQLRQEAQGLRQQLSTSQETTIQLQREAQSLRQQATASQATVTQLQWEVQGLRQQLVAATTTTPVARPVVPPSPATTPVTTSVVSTTPVVSVATTPVVTPSPVTTPVIAPPPMEDATTRLRRHPVKRFDSRNLGRIQYLVIQHSVLSGEFPPERIADYLVEKKQWPGIGYHFYITSDGTIYQTNRLETVCYFAGSNVQDNPLGVCVCFAGNFTDDVPTEAQLSSGGKLLAFLMQELRLPMESIRGHKEFVVTQSPGNQWDSGRKWRDMLLAEVRAAQA